MNRNHLSGGSLPCCCGSGSGGSGGGGSALERIIESRADALTGVAGMTFWHEPFVVAPGTRGSYWRDMHATDTGIVDTAPGGVLQVFANAGYGLIVVDPHDGYPAIVSGGPSIVGEISADEPFYMFARFRLLSAPGGGGPGGWQEGQCAFVIGLVDPTTMGVVGMGIAIDAESHFGAVGGNVGDAVSTEGLTSSVARDFDTWHVIELFTEGGKFWLKVDNGTRLDVSELFPGTAVNGTPFVEVIATDVLQPAIDIDHITFAAGRNGAALSPLVPSGDGIDGLTALGEALVTAETEAAAQTVLDLVPGVDVQEQSAILDALAGVTAAADKVPYFDGASSAALATFSAAGRAMAGAADDVAQRELLGIPDVGDLRNFALADAIALLGLTRPQVVIDEPFKNKPGVANSVFNVAGGTIAISTLGQGGWWSLTTGAGASSLAACHNNERAPDVTNPSTKKWYALVLFAFTTTVDGGTVIRIGLYDAPNATSHGVSLGMHGPTDPTMFGFFQEDGAGVTTGVLSSVAVDQNVIHLGRLWGDALGNVYGRIDGESAKTFPCTVTDTMMAHMLGGNGAGGGARGFAMGHFLLITE